MEAWIISLPVEEMIAYVVNILSLFMVKPHESHSIVAKRVLWYLKGTINFDIEYTNECNAKMIGHSDSEWDRILDDKKSTMGYVFNIRSWAISWSSKKQSIVSLLYTKAEYKALCSATYEYIWIRRILEDVG